jgi:hypothetical protein
MAGKRGQIGACEREKSSLHFAALLGAEYCIIFLSLFMSRRRKIILCINLMFLPIHFLFHDTLNSPPR